MDMATGMEMVAAAVFSEAETPLGHVAFLGEGGEELVEHLRTVYERYESTEMQRPAEDRQEIVDRLRQLQNGLPAQDGQAGEQEAM